MVCLTLMTDSFNCPACGGPLTSVNPISRSVVCAHCGNLLRLDNSSWLPAGQIPSMLDAPPLLRVGRSGTLEKRHFVVEGRVRLASIDGHWDEWWIQFEDGTGQWIEEDDGSYNLHHEQSTGDELSEQISTLRDLSPGSMLQASGNNWFITETGDATVTGVQGQLPVSLTPGFDMHYIDAVADGKELSLELWMNEVSASISSTLVAADIHWTD